jgi:hypothetical protein
MRESLSLRIGLGVVTVGALLAGMAVWPQASATDEKPVESEHRRGPEGLEGWTLNSSIPDEAPGGEKYPFTLVIARNGREIRRIEGDPFVWQWIFWADGKQVAYESGPLHFGMSCILADIETGHQLTTVDCYHELPKDAPEWVVKLEAVR